MSEERVTYAESLFMDSGAFGLFNQASRKMKGKVPPDFFSLAAGTDFRNYCDLYASFLKKFSGTPGLFCAVVDVIGNPEKTWEIQTFFEKEHGVRPIPVIHHGTPLKWLDRYLEQGHDLLCLGGLAHIGRLSGYMKWVDGVFVHLCPESNRHLPLVRVHGFGVTSWRAICRWPWWSVDSTSWCKTSAYGGLLVPRWERKLGFRFDRPPVVVNYSPKSSQRMLRHRHIDTLSVSVREMAEKWLLELGLPLGEEGVDGAEDVEGVTSRYHVRHKANLAYYKRLEESRPPWPYALEECVRQQHGIRSGSGFGL